MPAPRRRTLGLAIALGASPALPGCDGPQSVLAPSGPAAHDVALLWWVMLGGAALVFAFVIGLAFYAVRVAPDRHPNFQGQLLILGGGVALPVVVLTTLLVTSFLLSREMTRAAGADALRVEVIGNQWWWEVRYLLPDREEPVVSANELRLPVGRPVELLLRSRDVIHSFWIPRLAGKIDMIPGRTNRLLVEAEAPGTFRGQCAEYCGGPHALMAFYAVALEPQEFEAWLAAEAAPARATADPFLARGRALFLESGCGTCHTVRGTLANGEIGPDLTHLGGRLSLAAGILPNNVGTIAGWIADTQTIKPGNKMPSFNGFEGAELRAIAAWLASLE